MIKAICFDLDGSYFTPEGKQSFQHILTEQGFPESKVKHALYKSNEMFKFVRGEMSEEEYWEYLRVYLGLNKTIGEIEEMLVERYTLDEDVRELVIKSKEKGYISCICSNNFPTRVRALNKKYNFLDDFDVKIFSFDVGYAKPSKKIYEILLNNANVHPEEMVISDDNPLRMQGAKEIGINTLVYLSFPQFKTYLETIGVEL